MGDCESKLAELVVDHLDPMSKSPKLQAYHVQ